MNKREIRTWSIHGTPLKCLVCAHDRFWSRSAQLNTRGATFFGFDWANHSARCLVCERCSHLHWFHDLPEA